MMTAQGYQKLIREEIQNLPEELLAEIANFVYFVRLRSFQPQISPQEMRDMTLAMTLKQLSAESQAHIAEEFVEYEVNYPKE